jgi:hypothetical protein
MKNIDLLYMKHPGWCNPQMCTVVLRHTKLTILGMFVICHPVSTSSVGHNQEHECVEKLSAYRGVGNLVISILIYSNTVFEKSLDLYCCTVHFEDSLRITHQRMH